MAINLALSVAYPYLAVPGGSSGYNNLKGADTLKTQLRMAFTVACLLIGTTFAQSAEEVLKSKVASVHYPRLGEMARIQGDVRLNLNNGVVTIISGHPLLAPTAVESAKAFGSVQSQTNLDVTYHFVFVDTITSVPTVTTVKRGNKFERAILRALGLKTEKVVHDYRCEDGKAPISDVRVNGVAVEVWVYGRDFCLQTNTATLVARR